MIKGTWSKFGQKSTLPSCSHLMMVITWVRPVSTARIGEWRERPPHLWNSESDPCGDNRQHSAHFPHLGKDEQSCKAVKTSTPSVFIGCFSGPTWKVCRLGWSEMLLFFITLVWGCILFQTLAFSGSRSCYPKIKMLVVQTHRLEIQPLQSWEGNLPSS